MSRRKNIRTVTFHSKPKGLQEGGKGWWRLEMWRRTWMWSHIMAGGRAGHDRGIGTMIVRKRIVMRSRRRVRV